MATGMVVFRHACAKRLPPVTATDSVEGAAVASACSVPVRVTETAGLQPAPVVAGLWDGGAAVAADAASAAAASVPKNARSFMLCSFSWCRRRSPIGRSVRPLGRYRVDALNPPTECGQ